MAHESTPVHGQYYQPLGLHKTATLIAAWMPFSLTIPIFGEPLQLLHRSQTSAAQVAMTMTALELTAFRRQTVHQSTQ